MPGLSLSLPPPELASLTRTSQRAARVGAFALETWSRLSAGRATEPRERAKELSWVAENVCALHGLRPRLLGSVPSEPCILVSNHFSYFDPLVLASFLPLTAIAKSEVQSWPVIGELSRRLGTLYVSRQDAHSGARCLRHAMARLSSGVSVLVFPEGTTTQGTSVLPFKRGIFGVAARLGVPVVPVSLQYDRPDAAWIGQDPFLPHYVKSITKPCTRINVRFLEPMHVSSIGQAGEAAERARRAIAEASFQDTFAYARTAPLAGLYLASA